MEPKKYAALVSRLEVDATVNPVIFRSKVMLISSVAYVILFGMLIAMLLLIYAGIAYAFSEQRTGGLVRIVLFALVMAPVYFVVLRMFFMRLPVPQGQPLTPEDAPRLFRALEKMRKQLNGPPIHHVLLDDEFNASICQLPRWGLFGTTTNYLMLGLPYMLSMSPKEMLATVAHEYGHLSGNHGKVSAWIYRQRRTFGALYQQISDSADDNWVHAIMASMLHRFMPYYNAHTFVLSRQDEYEADQTATELVGAKANATGLIRGELLGRWIQEEFWPRLFRQADTSAQPLFLPYNAMRTAFKASYGQWATKESLALAWNVRSDLHDTHPALRDRVDATGEEAAVPACIKASAAEALLGSRTRALIDEFDQRWWEQEKNEWMARHQHVTRATARLQKLRRIRLEDLKLPDLQELALLSAEFESKAAAKPILEHLLRQSGGPFPRAEYEYGQILLAESDDRGLDHLATAAKADRHLTAQAAHTGYAYLARKQGLLQAQQWWDRVLPEEQAA